MPPADESGFASAEKNAAPLAETVELLRQERDKRSRELFAATAALKAAEIKLHKEQFGADDSAQLANRSYVARIAGNYLGSDLLGTAPEPGFRLAHRSFTREFAEMRQWTSNMVRRVRREGEVEATAGSEPLDAYQADLDSLVLSNEAVWDRERARPEIRAPWVIKIPYYLLCYMLDFIFDNRPIQRFWFLETVARMPYFSYMSMLHLYETLGWWRVSAEVKRVHFAEEWNEFHHLLIMESLGGDSQWVDRFLAQHSAIVYYLILDFLWLLSPSIAYNFSELIEAHAVDTYAEFVDANEELLKRLPAPEVARKYYCGDDMYMFDEFQTSRRPGERRPVVETLYDVFSNIRDDEGEHVKTMNACQDEDQVVQSPNAADAATVGLIALSAALRYLDGMESIEADTIASTITDLAAAIVDFVPF